MRDCLLDVVMHVQIFKHDMIVKLVSSWKKLHKKKNSASKIIQLVSYLISLIWKL